MKFRFRYVRSYFALGFGGEKGRLCDDEMKYSFPFIHVKIFLGPWILSMDFYFKFMKKVVDTH